MSKLTKEQFEHYIKGGKFEAVYNPIVTDDLSEDNNCMIGDTIVVFQNMIISPLMETNYFNQHAFNSDDIYGWIPEEDITIIKIFDEYIDNVEPLPQWMYKIIYTDQSKITPNFGEHSKIIATKEHPFVVLRQFPSDFDDYILRLSNPQADSIEKYIWQGKYNEEIKWKSILEHNEESNNT